MADNDRKRVVAAISGVMQYMQGEEEALATREPQPTAPGSINLWGLSGRQTAMQLRTLMQLRAFRGQGVRFP
ncbi:MAG: hypothetical protein ACLFOY_09205 [Desulfatibacillaceae bacterium]